MSMGRHNTQYSDIQPNGIQSNGTQHKGLFAILSINDT